MHALKRLACVVAGALLVAAMLPVGVARSDPLDLTCLFDVSVKFRPGITFTPQNIKVTVDGTLSNCVGTQVGQTGTGAALDAKAEGELACLPIAEALDATGKIDWTKPGAPNSPFTAGFLLEQQGVAVVLLIEGLVTSGPLQGDSFSFVFVLTQVPQLDCLGSGIRDITGIGLISFA